MENRKLVELAAKAAGVEATYLYGPTFGLNECMVFDDWKIWNPLGDDGDAFRLALKLQIKIEYVPEMDSVMCSLPGSMGATSVGAIGDVELRYAIVQAAAQLGLTMP